MQVVVGFTLALCAALFGFWKCPNIGWVQWLSIASVGAALYGPQMIIGLCGAEVVSKSGVSSAQVRVPPSSAGPSVPGHPCYLQKFAAFVAGPSPLSCKATT